MGSGRGWAGVLYDSLVVVCTLVVCFELDGFYGFTLLL
jgi:hypothetical protein